MRRYDVLRMWLESTTRKARPKYFQNQFLEIIRTAKREDEV